MSAVQQSGTVQVTVVEERENGEIVVDEAEAEQDEVGDLVLNLYDDWAVAETEGLWVEVGGK